MTNTVKFVRVTKIEDNEKDYLTVGKLYAVQHIDDEGDFHIIDDENDPYYVDKWNSELVEGKEVVKCTELLVGDDDKFIVGDLYEVLSTDSDGDVHVKDKNGARTLLVKDQFERVYAPAPETKPAKKYVRVTRLTSADKARKGFILHKVYEVVDTVRGSDVVVIDEHGKRGLLLASQIDFVDSPVMYIRVKELVGYDHEKRNFTVGKVYKVVRKTQHDNFIVKDDYGAESVLIKRQIEHVEGPKLAAKTEHVRVTRLLGVDKRNNSFSVGKVYKVLEKTVGGHVLVIDDNGKRTGLISSQIEYVEGHVLTVDMPSITIDGRHLSSLVFNPEPETKTKVKVINPSDVDCLVLKKGDVLDVIREIDHSYVVHVNGTGSWHINKDRVVEVNY